MHSCPLLVPLPAFPVPMTDSRPARITIISRLHCSQAEIEGVLWDITSQRQLIVLYVLYRSESPK